MNGNSVGTALDLPRATDILPPVGAPEPMSESRRQTLSGRIKRLLVEQDAVLVAHYYTSAELQQLADETGGHVADSLEMARFGHEHSARTLVVAGVRFMGETAKILNPEKRVLVLDPAADCSLDIGCPAETFSAFCDAHPERKVVVYANTSAAVKARSDWVVTSGIALKVVQHLAAQGEKILWAPDRHLGDYVRRMSGADMVLWPGSCVVHEAFKADALAQLKDKHPGAAVLVHPESPAAIIDLADVVGSTTQLIDAARRLDTAELIVATEPGIFHKMKEAAPHKRFLEAPTVGVGATCQSCAHCPWMAMNGLQKLAEVLTDGRNEVHIEEAIRARALVPLERMLAFARSLGVAMQDYGNA